jgi:alanine-synthesizing transaminase
MCPTLFSHRTEWPTHINRLSELASRARSGPDALLDLTTSNPTRCGFDWDSAGRLGPLIHAGNLTYDPDPLGLPSARAAIVAYYAGKGVTVSPEQIVLTSGTSEAYHFALRLLTHPGQAVLTPAPSYPLIDLLLDLNDIRQHRYPLSYGPDADGIPGWSFDAANARQARQAQTRALIAIHPNNPAGHTFSSGEREALVEFVRSQDMALIADEVFLDYADGPCTSFASEDRVLTFTLSGISKVLALPQMKLSWIVVSGPEPERREALRRLEIMADTFLSVNTPAQRSLADWFLLAPAVHQTIRARVQANRRTLAEALRHHPRLTLFRGCSGWAAILGLPDDTDDESAAYDLLQSQHVLTHPGYLFDFPSGAHLVVSLLTPPSVFAEGTLRMAGFLR